MEPEYPTAHFDALAARLDASSMARAISGLPNQIEAVLGQDLPALPAGPVDRLLVAGMGGSTLAVEVVNDLFLGKLAQPVVAVRAYEPPLGLSARDLLVVSSFSGNTEEALSVLEAVPSDLRDRLAVLSAGGELCARAVDSGIPLIRLPVEGEPEGFQPRSAVGYFVGFLARLLARSGLLPPVDEELRGAAEHLRSLELVPSAQSFANWLDDRIPVFYTDERHMGAVGRVAKIKINENSKRPAFFGALPEVNHNEMIGFTQPLGRFAVIYLHDPTSHPQIRRRFETMKRTFEAARLEHVAFREWSMPGANVPERVLAALMFADWLSYFRALLDGLDPSPVALVENFKASLGSPEEA